MIKLTKWEEEFIKNLVRIKCNYGMDAEEAEKLYNLKKKLKVL